MSAASDKGRSLERAIAALIRRKLKGVNVQRDKRSGAGSHQKADLVDWFNQTGLHIEAKNHKTVSIKEWYRQAKAGACYGQAPTVVFTADEHILACLSLNDLLDIVAELHQLRATPVVSGPPTAGVVSLHEPLHALVESKVSRGSDTCPNGHLLPPDSRMCLAKGCQYGRYKRKAKKPKP